MRGRKPKPTKLKLLTGNPGKRRVNKKEPQPRSAIPAPPDWLDEEAKAAWAQLVPELDRLELLTANDWMTFAALCIAWAELKAATETILSEGRTISVETKSGSYEAPHPAVAQQRSALKEVRSYSPLFGLDPSSRSRLNVEKPAKELAVWSRKRS